MYGGARHHLRLWWEFIGRPAFRARTLCRVGRHRWCDGWSQSLGDVWICSACERQREK